MINALPNLPANPSAPTAPRIFDDTVGNVATKKAAPAGPAMKPPGKKSNWKLFAALGVLVFIIIGAIVSFTLSTQEQDTRQQASVDTNATNSCTLTFTVSAPTETPASTTPNISCSVTAFRDEFSNSAGNYNLLTQQSTFNPGDNIVLRVNLTNNGSQASDISMSDVLTGGNLENVGFIDSNCTASAYNATNKTLDCPTLNVGPGATMSRTMRVKLVNNAGAGISMTDTATARSGDTSTTCNATFAVAGSTSTTTTTTTTQTSTVVGCNQTCVTNSDCAATNQICYDTGSTGKKCRLESNVTSSACSQATTTSTTTTTGTTATTVTASPTASPTAQPKLPAELPVSGAHDGWKFILGGAAALLLGGAALLLL
jgi:hypothetical protein